MIGELVQTEREFCRDLKLTWQGRDSMDKVCLQIWHYLYLIDTAIFIHIFKRLQKMTFWDILPGWMAAYVATHSQDSPSQLWLTAISKHGERLDEKHCKMINEKKP